MLRAGDPVDLRSDLLAAQGDVMSEATRPKEGLGLLEQAAALLEKAGAAVSGSPLAARLADVTLHAGGATWRTGDETGAIALNRKAIALYRQLYGPDSPSEAFGWHNLGEVERVAGKLDDALEAFRTAVRIREARLGDSPNLALSIAGVGSVLSDQKHWKEGLAAYERAQRIDRALLPADDLQQVPAMIGRARAMVHLDMLQDAARGYQETVALMDRAGVRTTNLGITIHNLAELMTKLGRCEDALGSYRRAIAVFEEARGKDAGILLYPLVGEGRCLLSQRRSTDAIAPLERARQLKVSGSAAGVAAQGRFFLGRALVESGRDRKRSLADARAARDVAAAAGIEPDDLREMDGWLASHH